MKIIEDRFIAINRSFQELWRVINFYTIISRFYRKVKAARVARYLNERTIIGFGYIATAALIAVFGLLPVFVPNANLAGAIGDYLSGAGQLIILIWVLVTFWLQRAENIAQRDELLRQDKSNQQRNIIFIYDRHIVRLEVTVKNFVSSHHTCREGHDNTSTSNPFKDNADYVRLLLNNDRLQRIIRADIENEDSSSSIFVDQYVRRFEILRQTIIDVDISNHLYNALLSDSDHYDLYFLLRNLRK